MSSKTTFIGAVEIGTAKVVALVGEHTGREIVIIGCGECSSRGVIKGSVVDYRAATECTHNALEIAERDANERIGHVYLAQTGGHLEGFYNEASLNVKAADNMIEKDDIRTVCELAKAKDLPLGRMVVHNIRRPFRVDGRLVPTSPENLVGQKLEVGYWTVHGQEQRLADNIHVIRGFNLEVSELVLSSLASGHMVTSMEERQNGVLAIDIGAGTTDYVLYRNGAPHTTGVVAVGGGHFTNDISIGLRLTEAQAEKLKLRFGRAVVQARDKSEKVWLDGNFSIGDRQFPRQAVESITAARAWELLEVVKKKLGHAFAPETCAGGVVLTGGAAKLPSLAVCAAKVFGAPARLGEAPAWVNENLRDPGYHTALGILYFGVIAQGDRAAAARGRGGFLHNVTRLFRIDVNSPNELPLEHQALGDRSVAIKLVGVGGAGSNAVDRLKMECLARLQLAVVNTDHQALSSSPVQDKVLIGMGTTRGLGAGGDPELGREAAEADRAKIAAVVKDCDLVFLIAGMGGGTGGGASPVVAEIAAEEGALVIAFVTLPFSFEGGRRLKQAEEGLAALRRVCDAVIPLPNDILLQEAADNETVLDSFARADEWIGRGVKSIWSMLSKTGLINVDFATLRQAFQQRGAKTLFGLAEGAGENAAAEAIASLKLCPLLHTPEFSRKADRLLVNITGGTDLTLPKVNEIMNAIADQFGRDSHIIMGAVIDEGMQGRVEISVLGASDMGSRGSVQRRPIPVRPRAAAPRTEEPAPSREAVAAPAAAAEAAPKPTQEEFGFGEVESRGQFERTDRNLFDGQDLDVPTYLRRGIKIAI